MSDFDQLAIELHKPIIKKFEKRRVEVKHIDETFGADLVDMIYMISKPQRKRSASVHGLPPWVCLFLVASRLPLRFRYLKHHKIPVLDPFALRVNLLLQFQL
jgi:hypothetical protein